MKNELGKKVYRKLTYFFENKIPIHLKRVNNGGWANGEIIDLNEKKLTFVLREFVDGEIPFLCEDVELNSIVKFIPKGEKK